jgi:hypothetical protein
VRMNTVCGTAYNSMTSAGGRVLEHANDSVLPIVDHRLYALLSYWLALRDGRSIPNRQDFDPTKVPFLLNGFWILKRDAATGRYRFHLAGEEIRSLLGRRIVGEYVDDLFVEHGRQFTETLDQVTSMPGIHHMIGSAYQSGRHGVHTERLALPMADNGVIDTVFGATVYQWPTAVLAGVARFSGTATQAVVPISVLDRTAR